MNKKEFLEGLGLALPEDKVTEIVVPPDKVKKVADDKGTADEPVSTPEPSDTDERIKEQVGDIETTAAKLEGQIEGSASVLQVEQIRATLGELKGHLEKAEETLKAVACLHCGKIHSGRSLIQELPAREFNRRTGKLDLDFLSLFSQKLVQVYFCPDHGLVRLEEEVE